MGIVTGEPNLIIFFFPFTICFVLSIAEYFSNGTSMAFIFYTILSIIFLSIPFIATYIENKNVVTIEEQTQINELLRSKGFTIKEDNDEP